MANLRGEVLNVIVIYNLLMAISFEIEEGDAGQFFLLGSQKCHFLKGRNL